MRKMRQSAKYVAVAYSRFSDMPILNWDVKTLNKDEKKNFGLELIPHVVGLVLTRTKSSSTRHRDQPCYRCERNINFSSVNIITFRCRRYSFSILRTQWRSIIRWRSHFNSFHRLWRVPTTHDAPQTEVLHAR